MKKLSVLLLLFAMAFVLVGCPEYQLRDETQLENLQTLKENYEVQQDYFADDETPPEFLVDSYITLLEEAIALEESKAESWEEQARQNGWEEPEDEE